jgi:DNA-binding NarL/FixJ family response regulator
MKKTRVLLADDHGLVRAGFRSLLEKIPSVEVVGEARDGREALALLENHRPDVVLMDIAMPSLNGLEAVARARKEFSNTKVIILSMHTNEEYVVQALRAGRVRLRDQRRRRRRAGPRHPSRNKRRNLS